MKLKNIKKSLKWIAITQMIFCGLFGCKKPAMQDPISDDTSSEYCSECGKPLNERMFIVGDQEHGIKETKELLTALIELTNAVGASMEDGRFSYGDIRHFYGVFSSLPSAVRGIDKIPTELGDLDPLEREELMRYITDRVELPDDRIEEYVEKALKVLVSSVDLIKLGLISFGDEDIAE